GPAVLRCSQFVVKELLKGNNSVLLSLDILPEHNEASLVEEITQLVKTNPKRSFKNIIKEFIPERLLHYILSLLKIEDEKKGGNISNDDIIAFVEKIKQFT